MRRAVLLIACLAVLSPAAAAAKSDPGRVLGPATADARDDGVADLVSARLEQNGHRLTVWLGFSDRPNPAKFSRAGGGRICVWLTVAGTARPLCASSSRGSWQFGKRREVLTPGKRRLGLRFADDVLKLRPGQFRWRVTATAARCKPDAEAPSCTDRVPEAPRDIIGRVYLARLTGCRATGPAQVRNGSRDRPRIALTFDDGPWSSTTDSIVRLLGQHRARGTFFQVGQQLTGAGVARARRIVAAGNELANHSFNHARLGSGGSAATSQMVQTNAAIRKATGFTPCLFRPPYGSTGSDLVRRVRDLGMTSVLWDVDTNDYRRQGVGRITSHLLRDSRSGSIVLMHDGGGDRSQTVSALAAALPELQRRYELVTVSELLGYRQTFALVR